MIDLRTSIFHLIKILLGGALISSGFIFLDGFWISLLPTLDISFGKVPMMVVLFTILRSGILFFWFLSIIFLSLFHKKIFAGKRYIWLAIINLIVLCLEIYSFAIEPMHLTVGKIEVSAPGLIRPIRIVQLSDIHVERTTQRERDLPALVQSLKPDMIVMTGDYPNESYAGSEVTEKDLRTLVSQLNAPLGIYAVNGNVETPGMMHVMFKGLRIRMLDNEVIRIPELGDHFVILGMDYNDPWIDENVLPILMRQVKPDDFSLLLYHKPDIIYKARDLGVNLYLAGHTHGGQIRFPFYGALYANSRYGKSFEMGLYQLGKTTLYVSRGLGMVGGSGPRARFLAPPEVVVIDLIPADLPGQNNP